jgi:hypothetical protein
MGKAKNNKKKNKGNQYKDTKKTIRNESAIQKVPAIVKVLFFYLVEIIKCLRRCLGSDNNIKFGTNPRE